MRIVSHTCSNTEIVCALGGGNLLVGVDSDSDYPPEIVAPLPKLGRDLDLDTAQVLALKPDLVLTSLTVPGHERVVEALRAAGLPLIVIDPLNLDQVYDSIIEIAEALGVLARGRALVAQMQAQMPAVEFRRRPRVLVEWWPKPVIAPARDSWINGLLELAGGENPWADSAGKSVTLEDAAIIDAAPDAIVMSWCGVKVQNYRADVVARRPGHAHIPAVCNRQIHAISEEFLGRPGPRLVEGYRALREIIGE
ncbi:MAG: ABC transporter substrate-binding protein [Stenotrophobium sp.]